MRKAVGAEFTLEVARSEAMSRHTSFGIGGAVDYFLKPRSVAGVRSALRFCRERNLAFFILGGGTNVLAADEPETSAVIHTAGLRGFEIDGEIIRCGAGEPLGAVVNRAARAGLSGLEGLVGIPGTVGGACSMNAGGRFGEIGDVVAEIEAVAFSGRREKVHRSRLHFDYRRGPFSRRVITGITLRLKRAIPEEVAARMKEIMNAKRAAQPLDARSAGCVFRNPAGESAGKLIEIAGLKGLRCGDAEVSARHANFIVNLGAARAGDVINLMEHIRKRVYENARKKLSCEIVFLK